MSQTFFWALDPWGIGPSPCSSGEADCEQVDRYFSQLQTLVSVRKEGKQDDGLESVGATALS